MLSDRWTLLEPRPTAAGLLGLIRAASIAAFLLGGSGVGAAARAWEVDEPGASYQRKVQIPQRAPFPAIVTTDFFTQGGLDEKGETLAVHDGRGEPASWRVLQVGPGDYCRIAFQTTPKQYVYKIYYGVKAERAKPPAWTSAAGLVLETRRWKSCDPSSLDSVRAAFRGSIPHGAAFVPSVFLRYNPFMPDPEPFLSDYRGTLHVNGAGRYRFYTSSQDASFLLIDGRLVVAAPGRHGPVGDARFKGEIELSAGPHAFEYVHAAAGADACMTAAWQPPGSTKPEIIPPQAFDSEAIARLPAVSVKHPHEYVMESVGEVPLADGDPPLIRVQFRLVASQPTTSRARVHWDFGDGGTSNQSDPTHIYLHPGIYKVTMRGAAGGDESAVVNRVPVERAVVLASEPEPVDSLASYLTVVAKYDPAKLDPTGLLQLVRALDQAGAAARAAKAGRAGLLARSDVDSETALATARMVGGLLRDRLDDPEGAFSFWQGAAAVFTPEPWKAECEIEAADVAVADLLKPGTAKPLLDSATARSRPGGDPGLSSRLNRVWGDWYARQGDKPSAIAAYTQATTALGSRRPTVEQDAWRGALSRSTEEFLRDRELDRARSELRRWQDEYPIDKLEGYLTFLQASYRAARGKLPQAVALAGDLLAVNPDSPYADRLLFLAGECEEKMGRIGPARTCYQSLITDYPGSPLVELARQRLAEPARKLPPRGKP